MSRLEQIQGLRKCNCKSCIEGRLIDAAIMFRQFDIVVRFLRRLQNENCSIGEDLAWHKCIMDGSWPTAQKQLYRALGKTMDLETDKLSKINR